MAFLSTVFRSTPTSSIPRYMKGLPMGRLAAPVSVNISPTLILVELVRTSAASAVDGQSDGVFDGVGAMVGAIRCSGPQPGRNIPAAMDRITIAVAIELRLVFIRFLPYEYLNCDCMSSEHLENKRTVCQETLFLLLNEIIRLDCVNQSNPHSGIDFGNQFLQDLSANPQKFIQEPIIPAEERPKRINGGQNNIQVRNFQDILCELVDPVIDFDFSTRGTEAGLP